MFRPRVTCCGPTSPTIASRLRRGRCSVSVFATPCGYQNGHTLDAKDASSPASTGRRISRLDPDGVWRALATHFEGKRLNSPNDVVVKSDGTIWFSDPTYGIDGYYEGALAQSEIGGRSSTGWIPRRARSRPSRATGCGRTGSHSRPTSQLLYVADTGETHVKDTPRAIHAYGSERTAGRWLTRRSSPSATTASSTGSASTGAATCGRRARTRCAPTRPTGR